MSENEPVKIDQSMFNNHFSDGFVPSKVSPPIEQFNKWLTTKQTNLCMIL